MTIGTQWAPPSFVWHVQAMNEHFVEAFACPCAVVGDVQISEGGSP